MNSAKVFQTRPEFHPLSILRALWKGRVTAGLLWIGITAIACVVVMRLPSVYSSDALIVVDSPKIPERFASSIVNNDFQDRLTRITQQIQSSTRLKEIMDEVKLYPNERKNAVPEDLIQRMRKDIKLTMEGGQGRRANAFRIGFEGDSAAVVAQVANRLANLYVEENLKVRESQAEGTTEFVDAQLQESKKRLDDLEAAMSRYKQQHSGELPQQEGALAGGMARVQMDLRLNVDAMQRAHDSRQVLESSLAATEATVAALSKRTEAAAPAAVAAEPDSAPAASAPAPNRARPSDAVAADLEAMQMRYTDRHPEVRRLKQKLEAMRASEADDVVGPAAAPQTAAGPRPERRRVTAEAAAQQENPELPKARERVAAIKAQMRRTDKEISEREEEQGRLQRESVAMQRRLEALPLREQELLQLTRDYQITKTNYESLMGKKLSAEMSTDLERRQKAERFTILEPARVPVRPARPNRLTFGFGGAAAGLLIGIAAALLREWKRDVLLGEWELADEYPILGRLPRIHLATASAPEVNG